MDYKTSKKPAAKVKLICFPYAGGGTHVFIPWQQLLHPHIELCIVQPPGRGSNFELAPFAEKTFRYDEDIEIHIDGIDLASETSLIVNYACRIIRAG